MLEEVDFIRGGVFLEEVFFFVGGGDYFWRRSISLEEVYFLEEVFFVVGGGDVCFWSRVALTDVKAI